MAGIEFARLLRAFRIGNISFPLTLTLSMNQCQMSNVQCAMCNVQYVQSPELGIAHCSLLIFHFGEAARARSGVQCAKFFGEFSPGGEGTPIPSLNQSTHIGWLAYSLK